MDNRSVYPADFIAEGVDQTRGWFFTLHAVAGMIFDSVSYKAVVSNGLVLDKDGNKMSKRLGNAVDPFTAMDENGSDAVRWYMISNTSPWENLKYDDKGVKEVSRKFFATLHNTYSFFALYANVDGFDNSLPQVPVAERPEIDRWILSQLNSLIKAVDVALDDYEPTVAARAVSEFVIDNLSNWYVRLNRKRFWGGEMTQDKLAAYQTLYTCLETVSRLMAPFAPFYADRLYRDLHPSLAEADSVHLSKFPEVDEACIDKDLERRMATAQTITSMVLALRRKVNIKVRQPLSTLMIPVVDEAQRADIEAVKDLILSEVNVKEIKFVGNEDGVLVKRIKPDFKKLGPKHGKAMKAVAAALTTMAQADILAFERNGYTDMVIDGETRRVDAQDVEIISEDIPGWLVANEGNITIALDVTVNENLRNEGVAREIVNRLQNLRKDRNFNITDKISVTIEPSELIAGALSDFGDYIARQVLAVSLDTATVAADDVNAAEIDIDENIIRLSIHTV